MEPWDRLTIWPNVVDKVGPHGQSKMAPRVAAAGSELSLMSARIAEKSAYQRETVHLLVVVL